MTAPLTDARLEEIDALLDPAGLFNDYERELRAAIHDLLRALAQCREEREALRGQRRDVLIGRDTAWHNVNAIQDRLTAATAAFAAAREAMRQIPESAIRQWHKDVDWFVEHHAAFYVLAPEFKAVLNVLALLAGEGTKETKE